MKRALVIAACAAAAFLTVGIMAFALEWPVAGAIQESSFGTFSMGSALPGLALGCPGAEVRAVADGEFAFSSDGPALRGDLPSPLGSIVAVAHPQELLSIYACLAPGSAATRLRSVTAGEPLARAGRSGFAESEGLLFLLYDGKEGQFVNPLMLLPALADEKAPVIKGLVLQRGGTAYRLGEAKTIKQGPYRVFADISDSSASAKRVPFSFRLVINGASVAERRFDVIRGEAGQALLFSEDPLPQREFYDAEGRCDLGEQFLSRGKVTIDFSTRDYAGNERSVSFTIAVE